MKLETDQEFLFGWRLGHKYMLLTVSILFVFTSFLVFIIWQRSSASLSRSKVENLNLMSRLISKDIDEIRQNIVSRAEGFHARPGAEENARKIATFGPLYVLQRSEIGQEIDLTSSVYLLQASARIIEHLMDVVKGNDVSEANLFIVSPHRIVDKGSLPFLRVTKKETILFKYLRKGDDTPQTIYRRANEKGNLRDQSFFDNASLDPKLASHAMEENGFEVVSDHNNFHPDVEMPNILETKVEISSPKNESEDPYFVATVPIKTGIFDLSSSQNRDSIIGYIQLKRPIDKKFLSDRKQKLATDLAFVENNKSIASTLAPGDISFESENILRYGGEKYWFAKSPLAQSKNGDGLSIFLLSKNSEVMSHIHELVIVLAAIIVVEAFLRLMTTYWTTQKIVVRPITKLLSAVVRLRTQADFNLQIGVSSQDEVGALAFEFNKMVVAIRNLLNRVKSSENTLRRILNCTTELSRSRDRDEAYSRATQTLVEEFKDLIAHPVSYFFATSVIKGLFCDTDVNVLSQEAENKIADLARGNMNQEIGMVSIISANEICISIISEQGSRSFIYCSGMNWENLDGSMQNFVRAVAISLNIALSNFLYFELKQKEAILNKEMSVANVVQQNLVPKLPYISGLEIAGRFKPSAEIGGDWYGVYFDAENRLLFTYICDVTGHGFSSALLTGVICGAVSAGKHLESMLTRTKNVDMTPLEKMQFLATSLNQVVLETGGLSGKFATMCFSCLNVDTGQLTILNNGHPAPLHIQKSGVKAAIVGASSRLGVSKTPVVATTELQLMRGDSLFLYTDGLVENTGPLPVDVLSQRFLKSLLKEAKNAHHALTLIDEATQKVWGNVPAEDDVSMLFVKWLE